MDILFRAHAFEGLEQEWASLFNSARHTYRQQRLYVI